jgi:DNA-binding transcriptional regulator YbjK
MTNEDADLLRQHLLDVKAERNAYKDALEKIITKDITDVDSCVTLNDVFEIARQALKIGRLI